MLWKDLTDAFKSAFAHTSRIKIAKKELGYHKIKGDNIDNYIAKFKNLLQKAKIPQKATVMNLFRDRLKKWLYSAILKEQT